MRAEFDGQDYLFYISKEELSKLPEQSLEAQLLKPFKDSGWNKRAVLKSGENNSLDGIELKTLPEEAQTWNEFQEIDVTLNRNAQNYIRQKGSFGTRNYSDKVEIIVIDS